MIKVLLSIKPSFAQKIFDGVKRFEYRRQIFRRQDVSCVIIYVTAPVQQIVGEFKIEKIHTDSPQKIWKKTANGSGISKNFYQQYFGGKAIAHAIQIGTVKKYQRARSLAFYKIKHAPQSFAYIED